MRAARPTGVLVALAAAILLGGAHVAAHAQHGRADLDAAAHVLLVTAALSVLLRSRPTIFLGVATVIASTYLALGYPYGPILLIPAFAAFIIGLRTSRHGTELRLGLAASALVAGAFVGEYDGGSNNWFSALLQLVWLAVPGLIGQLRQSAGVAHAYAQEESALRADEESRLRLAREVHDVVGHDLSVISLQAGVALHVLDRDPTQVRAALEAIRRTSIEALDELRATLALTRGDSARRDTGAGLARLPAVVSGLELCGLAVTVSDGFGRAAPPAVDLVAFRVAQESLTNVLRHSAAASASVTLAESSSALVVTIRDPGPRSAVAQQVPGRGLIGLAERVREIGGSVESGPCEAGWQVRARLPLVGAP